MKAEKELRKIMLIEDEEDIHIIAQIALEDIGGFTVKYCASGQEAVEEIKNFLPDLILLDLMMPGMDGITTLKKIRLLKGSQNIPVIFLTAKATGTSNDLSKEPGVIGVISKPFEPTTLSDDLRKIWNTQYEKN